MKTGVLVVNVGTPDAPRAPEVRRYLREFLGDPRVLDMNPVGRWLLLNLIILPRRPQRSAEAYAQIWTAEGSPLLVNGQALVDGLRVRLPGCHAELGMRYGNPSMIDALERLHAAGCERLVVFPLYPQYASSTTGTTVEHACRWVGERWNTPSIAVVPPFYEDAGLIAAHAALARRTLAAGGADHVLMSFHGLPERHVLRSDETGKHCLAREDCCAAVGDANRSCYRAHCYATARALAAALDLADDGYTVSFQSRLGRTPWIRPYTDEILPALRERGVKRLAVMCPAFVSDCLETLEEIGLRLKASFEAAGGEAFHLVPCVNGDAAWLDAAADLLRKTSAWVS